MRMVQESVHFCRCLSRNLLSQLKCTCEEGLSKLEVSIVKKLESSLECIFLAGQASGFPPNSYLVDSSCGRTYQVSPLSLVSCSPGSLGESKRGGGVFSPNFVSSIIGNWSGGVRQLGVKCFSSLVFLNPYPY